MEHHDWEWSDDDSGHGEAETADLGPTDLPGESFDQFGDHDLGDDPAGGHDQDDLGDGGHRDSLDEPLGTENAAATYDADVAGHDDYSFTGAGDNHSSDGTDDSHPDTGGPTGHEDPAGSTTSDDLPESGHTLDDGGHGLADHTPDGHDPGDQGVPDDHGVPVDGHELGVNDAHGDPTGDHLVGVDPDVDHRADDPAWHESPFPPELHLETTPEPVDGFPWSDPATLGGHDDVDDYTHAVLDHGSAEPHELASYSGLDLPAGTDPWTALFSSEDPATSTLAHWWAPGA